MLPASIATLVVLLLQSVVGPVGPDGWFKYTSPEGRFSVLMPKEFHKDASYFLSVGYFDYGPEEASPLDRARDRVLKVSKGTLLSEHPVGLEGRVGRETRAAVAGPAKRRYLARTRYYEVAGRVYFLHFIFVKSGDDPDLTKKCEKFFDSFEVVAGP